MTDKYPFDFGIQFEARGNNMCDQKFELNQDGTFKASYLVNCVDKYWWIKYEAEGKFEYSATNRRLTLNSEKLEQVSWCPNGDDEFKIKCALNAEEVNKMVEKTFRQVQIDNYFWASPKFDYPWLTLPKKSEAEGDYDFNGLFVNSIEMVGDGYYGAKEFKRVLDLIKLSNDKSQGKVLATTITEPLVFEEITLFPNGTLKFRNDTSSWDRDGPYNWDSYISCNGKWVYDTTSKTIKLFYENFTIDNDGTMLDTTNQNLPKEHETKNFYFESNYINTISVRWNYGTFESAGLGISKKK